MVEDDLVESLPDHPDENTVVSFSCSSSVRSRCPPAQGAIRSSRDVVGDVRRQDGNTSSRSDMYRWVNIMVPYFRGGDK